MSPSRPRRFTSRARLPMPVDAMSLRAHAPLVLGLALAIAALGIAADPARAAIRPGKPNRAAVATGPRVERSLPLLGATLDIEAAPRADAIDTTRAAAAAGLALDEAARLESVLGPGEGSELARLNRTAATDRFPCSADLYAALDTAVALAAESDGACDPTSAPLQRLWAESPAPERAALSAARRLVGWRLLLLDPGGRTVRFLRPEMSVSLDAVAAGYVLDRVAAVMRGRGIVRAKLELGNSVLAFTPHDPWKVTVPDPDGEPALTLALANAAYACEPRTGETESRPAIDPRSGEPVRGRARVAVIAPSAARAGALARALLVMGRDEAESYARAHRDLGVLWIEPAGDFVSLRVWAWNLGAVTPEPSTRVEWMTRP